MPLRLRTRLLLLNLCVIGATSGLLVCLTYQIVAHQMRQEMWGFLSDEFREYGLKYAELLDDLDTVREDMSRHFTKARMRYPIICRIHDAQGTVIAQAENVPGTPDSNPVFLRNALEGQRVRYTAEAADGITQYWFSIGRIELPTGEVFAFEVGMNVTHMHERIRKVRNYMLLSVPVILIVALIAAWWVTYRSLYPFANLLNNMRHIRSSSLDRRLPTLARGDELGELTVAINEMLAEVEGAFTLAKEFTSDAAHELRSPLSRLTVMLEQGFHHKSDEPGRQALLGEALQECTRLRRLINDLMMLARLDAAEYDEEMGSCNLVGVIEDQEELWRMACDERSIQLEIEAEPSFELRGRPALLRRLLMNLTDNALQYTPRGGRIRIHAAKRGETFEVSVANTSERISQEAFDRLFQRFYRIDGSRNRETGGTGLGLSICKKIADLHHAEVTATCWEESGVEFRVAFPISAPPVTQEEIAPGSPT